MRIGSRLNSNAVTKTRKSPRINVTSAASMAISVPVPIATPTSAWTKAGASLIPSPTIPTTRPFPWSFLTTPAFSAGKTWAKTFFSGIPTSRATALAVNLLSPVTI